MSARRVIDFLGLQSGMAAVLGMVILVGTGGRMAERFLPIYLIALGAGPMIIGLLNSLQNLLSALYSLAGGYLSDRIGPKLSLAIFNLMAMAGYLVVIAVPSWHAVIAGAVLFLSWGAISLPATMDLIFKLQPAAKRTMGVSMHSMVQRIPMALGPLIGGVLIDRWGEVDGIRAAFGAAILMALVSMLIQQKLITEDSRAKEPAPPSIFTAFAHLRFSPGLKNLLVADILVRFCEQIPYAFVVVWCMKLVSSPVTASQFGLLSAVEMATAMLIYVPVAYFADRGAKKPFVAATFLFFSLFPVALLFCQSFEWLVAAFVLRGLKEFGEPARKAMILDLAPDHAKASTFGLYYLIRDSIVSAGVLAGALLWQMDPKINLLVATGFGLLATAWFVRKG
ncbi:MFS transporter [bacterium]|nr:MFS transporter [bacterium]